MLVAERRGCPADQWVDYLPGHMRTSRGRSVQRPRIFIVACWNFRAVSNSPEGADTRARRTPHVRQFHDAFALQSSFSIRPFGFTRPAREGLRLGVSEPAPVAFVCSMTSAPFSSSVRCANATTSGVFAPSGCGLLYSGVTSTAPKPPSRVPRRRACSSSRCPERARVGNQPRRKCASARQRGNNVSRVHLAG